MQINGVGCDPHLSNKPLTKHHIGNDNIQLPSNKYPSFKVKTMMTDTKECTIFMVALYVYTRFKLHV